MTCLTFYLYVGVCLQYCQDSSSAVESALVQVIKKQDQIEHEQQAQKAGLTHVETAADQAFRHTVLRMGSTDQGMKELKQIVGAPNAVVEAKLFRVGGRSPV